MKSLSLRKNFVIMAAVATAFASPAMADQQADKIKSKIEQSFGISVKEVTKSKEIGLYEVPLPGTIGFISPDGKYLIVGDAIEIETKKSYTKERLAELYKFDPKQLDKDFIVFTLGKKDGKEMWLFSDPNCPFCKKLEQEIPELAKTFKIHYVPLGYQNGSREEVSEILCAPEKDRVKKWHDAIQGDLNVTEEGQKCRQLTQKIIEFAQQHGIVGTPTIVRADGKRHEGYTSADKIKSFMEQ